MADYTWGSGAQKGIHLRMAEDRRGVMRRAMIREALPLSDLKPFRPGRRPFGGSDQNAHDIRSGRFDRKGKFIKILTMI